MLWFRSVWGSSFLYKIGKYLANKPKKQLEPPPPRLNDDTDPQEFDQHLGLMVFNSVQNKIRIKTRKKKLEHKKKIF